MFLQRCAYEGSEGGLRPSPAEATKAVKAASDPARLRLAVRAAKLKAASPAVLPVPPMIPPMSERLSCFNKVQVASTQRLTGVVKGLEGARNQLR